MSRRFTKVTQDVLSPLWAKTEYRTVVRLPTGLKKGSSKPMFGVSHLTDVGPGQSQIKTERDWRHL